MQPSQDSLHVQINQRISLPASLFSPLPCRPCLRARGPPEEDWCLGVRLSVLLYVVAFVSFDDTMMFPTATYAPPNHYLCLLLSFSISSSQRPCGDLRDDHCDVQGGPTCGCTNVCALICFFISPLSVRTRDLDANMPKTRDLEVVRRNRGTVYPEHAARPSFSFSSPF